MSFGKTISFVLALFCLDLVLLSGCVTRTERISPYERGLKDESVWDELRRELGGGNSHATTAESASKPFYTRAARGVKETVSRWFHEDSAGLSAQEIAADRRRFEQKRAQALEQLRDQQEETQGEEE